jgi:hypothetical protein
MFIPSMLTNLTLKTIETMGLRLYVAKTYKVEFEYGIAFNYKVSELHDLLDSLNVSYSGETWDERFDVEKEEWLKGIEALKNLDNLEASEREEIEAALEACECTLPEAIELFQGYYDAADPDHDYLEFQFL